MIFRSFLALIAGAVLVASPAVAKSKTPVAPPSPALPTVVDPDPAHSPEDVLLLDLSNGGTVAIRLMPQWAPAHVERIKLLARRGFYDNVPWHRVIDWFMAQTGDPLGNGEGQSPYPDLKGEFTFRRDSAMPFAAVAEPSGARVGFFHSLPVQTQPDAAFALTGDGKVHGWGLYCPAWRAWRVTRAMTRPTASSS